MKIGTYTFNCGSSTCKYALFGIAFGFCFPLIALTFDTLIHLHLPLNLESIRFVHRENPLHYIIAVSYTHLRAHETVLDLVCRLLLETKKKLL